MSDSFSEKPLVPGPGSAPAPPTFWPGKTAAAWRRYVLPAVALVLVVGGIAWVTQFMPNWRAQDSVPQPNPIPQKMEPLLQFAALHPRLPPGRAFWDKENLDYAREFERGNPGHFDFPFENAGDRDVELGLLRTGCACSHVEVCFPPRADWERYLKEIKDDPIWAQPGTWNWQPLAIDSRAGVKVPPRTAGLVRVAWDGRKEPGSRLLLSPELWTQPLGKASERQSANLEVPVMMAFPAMVSPAKVNLDPLGANAKAPAEFFIWSSTRSKLNMAVSSADPLFVYEIEVLSPEDCKKLEEKLRAENSGAKVRAAHRLVLTIHEKKDGKQLDQGPLYHTVPLLLDGEPLVQGNPLVIGMVKSEIEVGAGDKDRGKINLRTFSAKEGIPPSSPITVSLWAKANLGLEHVGQEPAVLEVKLSKLETSGAKTKWQLEIQVPPNSVFGELPSSSAILLRTQTNPPRLIRIPVIGNGQS